VNILASLQKAFGLSDEDSGDVLARLLMAAKEDAAFRQRILSLLQVPVAQREPLVNTAVHEMQLRGEPPAACAAFATLGTDAGAKVALRILQG
jgi:hypothetical protein